MILPKPKIDVTKSIDRDSGAGSNHVDVVISRDGKGKSYTGVGNTPTEVVKDVVEKILNDPYTGEWVKKEN